jgi:hypothetical protein
VADWTGRSTWNRDKRGWRPRASVGRSATGDRPPQISFEKRFWPNSMRMSEGARMAKMVGQMDGRLSYKRLKA